VQDPKESGASVAPASQMRSATVLLLMSAEN